MSIKIDKENYVSHIQDSERLLEMRKILDKLEIVMNNHLVESTDFLDPYSRRLAKSILNRFIDIGYREDGGLEDLERKIITIYPDYYYLEKDEINISALRLKGNFENLSHKDFLGGVLGLGIDRLKIGDILIHEDYVDIVIKKEIKDFILFNLEKIGNSKVSVKEITLEELKTAEILYKEVEKTLSSYRLDVYISGIYNLSRQKSMALINSKKVKVNWEPIDKNSKEVEVGDIISIRGYGRSKLYSIEGKSKKGKIKARARILI